MGCPNRPQTPCPPQIPCGSGLARESGGSACSDVECAAVIASKPAPTWVVRIAHRPLAHPRSPVGAGLLAKAVGQLAVMLNVLPSSRAGSLPHGCPNRPQTPCPPQIPCGSGLARESGRSACLYVECATAFASKPAPTVPWLSSNVSLCIQPPCRYGLFLYGPLLTYPRYLPGLK
ncbi:hypothetical protein FBY09_1531 [Pseudomonas sp. SJZ101]|nr:hypothetical protein FBY02_15320 [Pseudomonas sp. SJZ078]TWC45067.1 hypothetical protein FBY11_1551 [Pseudomonas sp. SJZ124]TWC80372.1 hypothetical protein FBY09_1531 [Pseudomonas sp. SJZ101]